MMPVLVFSGGEPLSREDLFKLVKQANSLGITPALATNGTLIDKNVAEQILDSGIKRVSVSLDGATAEVHNKLRQLEGSFERAIEGIGYLRNQEVPFQINITLTKHNAGQLEDIYKLAKSLGAMAVHIFMLVPVGCGQSLAETDMLSPGQYEQKLLDICKLDGRGEIQMKVTCGPHYERVIRQHGCTNPVWKQVMEQALFQAEADTEEHRKDVWPASECCLSGIRAMYFHAATCPLNAATCLRRSFQISGTAAKTSHECVIAVSWKVNAESVDTGRYVEVAGAEHTPARAIIWPKSLFALTCRPK